MIRDITKPALITVIIICSFSSVSHAQLSRVGGGLTFSTGIENTDHKTGNPGLNARGVLEPGDKLWLVPELTFYMPGKRQHGTFGLGTTFFGTADVNATYTLATEKTILFYALAGANLSWIRTSYKDGSSTSNVMPGLNIGTGIEMIVEKDLNAFAQIKGVIGSYSQYISIGIGVHYYLSGRRYRTW